MDEEIIHRWNETVKPGDEAYILGDVSFHSLEDTVKLLKRLNGNLHLIAGNHDKRYRGKAEFKKCFTWIKDLYTLKVYDPNINLYKDLQRIELCHYALRTWNKSWHGSWSLYGHSHGNLPDDPTILSIDVGVDSHDFRPVSFEEIKVIMSEKDWVRQY
jgi:calcineurin-like phosphoesterase family protein